MIQVYVHDKSTWSKETYPVLDLGGPWMVRGTLIYSKKREFEIFQETVKVYYNVGGALEMSLEWR